MGAPFSPWWNTATRVALACVAAVVVGVPAGWIAFMRTPYVTQQGVPVVQPIPFDHRHHVRDDGIDCRYCHTTAETAPSAGMPSTETCMNCHSQVWISSPTVRPVRESYFADRPIEWRRVHDLPDFVHFDHSVHVKKGVGCETCHGRVDQMAEVARAESLRMSWCLDCHRNPTPQLRPSDAVTAMGWHGESPPAERDLRGPTNCSACHR